MGYNRAGEGCWRPVGRAKRQFNHRCASLTQQIREKGSGTAHPTHKRSASTNLSVWDSTAGQHPHLASLERARGTTMII